MSADQLKRASEQLYHPYSKTSSKSSSDAQQYHAWIAFRDAVAQAGTGPALVMLKEWISSNKVQGQEAAELLAALPQAARYPTPEYMDAFFSLASSEQVTRQRFLNTSAIMAFTDLVRKAQVDKDSAHNRYPVHSFGQFAQRNAKAVAEKYVPYLESQLKKAVSQGDSIKIQVYIRALGNTAHRKILSVYEPYLEGKHDMSDFQRLTMVASMDKMTKVQPRLVRSVLFKIYQNAGEAPEVRVAAVMQLMKTNPPAQILQRMAQYTNSDHSDQVSSAVKSAIESAAQLTAPQSRQLAQNAQAAVHLLTPRAFGMQYSKQHIRDYIVQQEQEAQQQQPQAEPQLSYKADITSLQSEDSIVPSSVFYNLRRNLAGFKLHQYQLAYMTSSADDLMDLLADQISDEQQSSRKSQSAHGKASRSHQSSSSSWTLDKIASMLNIDVDDQEQVEGNILINALGSKRFFAFDNHTIEQLPKYAKEAAESLRQGQRFNLTKMYDQGMFKIGFPTAMGLPFLYSFTLPTVAQLGGEIRAQSHPDLASGHSDAIKIPSTVNITAEIDLVYAAKSQGKLGFITPFNHQRYIAALEKNFQLRLPIRAAIDIDVENAKLRAKVQPLDQNRKQKLFEYSTVAFTAKQDILDFTPAVDAQSAEEIHVRPVQRWESTVGQDETGIALDVKAETEQQFLDMANIYHSLRRHDGLSAIIYGDYEQSINNNNFTVVWNPQQSSAKSVKITVAYDNDEDQSDSSSERRSHNKHRGSGESSSENDAQTSHTAPDSQERQQQLLQKAAAGIQDSTAHMVDMSVEFEGQSKAQYVATAAFASSPVADKSRFLVFLSKKPARETSHSRQYQAALQLTANMPSLPMANYQKALHADPTSYIKAQLNFGEKASSSAKITIQGKLKQTSERREFVRQHPMSALCEKQMQEGNYIQPACRNATGSANLLDQYKFTINYEKIPAGVQNATYKAYDIARYLGYPYVSEDIVSAQNKQQQIDVEVNFGLELPNSVNVSIDTPTMSSEFTNIRLNKWAKSIAVVHPQYSAAQRLAYKLYRAQQAPVCALDKTLATTFDNKTYPINLGKCWHVMAYSWEKSAFDSSSGSSSQDDQDQISVLARDLGSSSQRELMIIVGEDVVEAQPGSGSDKLTVKVNGQKAEFSQKSMAQFNDKNGNTMMQVYALPTGAIRMIAPLAGVEIIYDGARVKLIVSNSFRGQMRGLCGTFTGEQSDDFTTPQNLIVKDASIFAASYAIADSSCQGQAKEMHQRAQQAKGYKKVVLHGDVISESEAGRRQPRQKSSSPKKSADIQSQALRSSTKIVQHQGKTCFSSRKVPECASGYQSTKKVEKQVDFHCVSDKASADRWVSAIQKGASPDFSQKEKNYKAQVMVPERCVRK